MSKCVKCFSYFHPDWIVYEEIRGDLVKICAFCKVDKNELTVEGKDGKMVEKVTKQQATEAYKRYLNDLLKKPNIGKIVQKGMKK